MVTSGGPSGRVIRDKMRERRLRWQGDEDLVGAIQGLRIEGRWGRGGPKLTWEQVIQAGMMVCGIDGTLTQDIRAWNLAIRRPDPLTGRIKARVEYTVSQLRNGNTVFLMERVRLHTCKQRPIYHMGLPTSVV